MKFLAIESSCDETSVSIFCVKTNYLVQKTYSQISLHAEYSGVVPEIASRSHQEKLMRLCHDLCKEHDCKLEDIDCFAYTKGPGLVGALLVGACFTQSLSLALSKPVIPINHLEAHMSIPMYEFSDLQFPYICLLVSGGHTELVLVKGLGDYLVLGQTLDDAAGEAFDKGGKILGLPYPGGPYVSKLAFSAKKKNIPDLPKPLCKQKTFDMSFSGLKTSFMRKWQDSEKTNEHKADFAFALERTIIDCLLHKVSLAVDKYPNLPVVLAGGVACNSYLRSCFSELGISKSIQVYYPSLQYCTDNAAMVAYTAYLRYKYFGYSSFLLEQEKDVMPRWPLSSI